MEFKLIILTKVGLKNYLPFDDFSKINGSLSDGDELIVRGEITGDLIVDKNIVIAFKGNPTIHGNITVSDGKTLIMQGSRTITGSLITEGSGQITDESKTPDEVMFDLTVSQTELNAIDKNSLNGHELRLLKLDDGGTTPLYFNKVTQKWEP